MGNDELAFGIIHCLQHFFESAALESNKVKGEKGEKRLEAEIVSGLAHGKSLVTPHVCHTTHDG